MKGWVPHTREDGKGGGRAEAKKVCGGGGGNGKDTDTQVKTFLIIEPAS